MNPQLKKSQKVLPLQEEYVFTILTEHQYCNNVQWFWRNNTHNFQIQIIRKWFNF